jgi:acid stress-induced BolA-like protein IbaG/YrbA
VEGQISSELIESMKAKISDALQAQSVNIVDVYGDGRHVSIDVVAEEFEGKNAVARQRMVYKVTAAGPRRRARTRRRPPAPSCNAPP